MLDESGGTTHMVAVITCHEKGHVMLDAGCRKGEPLRLNEGHITDTNLTRLI